MQASQAAMEVTVHAYSRKEAQRLAGISERQLRSWEQQKLIAPTDQYGFGELLALRMLTQLRKKGVAAAKMRRALHAVAQKLHGSEQPLAGLQVYTEGKRIRVEIEGRHMEAESGQLLLDFGPSEISRLLEFKRPVNPRADADRRAEADRWFQRGLELEQSGGPGDQVLEAYQKAVELDSQSAGALVNLGTLYFNARNLSEAEKCYTQALEVDPEYALAHFDLANLYDERGHRAPALDHYLTALRISPNYADAHYNIALLYQSASQPLKAVRHWMTYLKLDPGSQWADVARRELTKLRKAAVVPGARGREDAG
jgi:tetratricopeptide (TPR) repeat protein